MIRRFFPFTIQQEAAGGYLLDDYAGGLAGYSFRKLASAYAGNCIKVRRSSDNTTSNIGFSGDYLDTSALTSFVGANDGFIDIWYDQSGNSKDISQATLANQPKIVSSGSLLVDPNGKAYADWDGTNDDLFTTSALNIGGGTNAFISMVLNKQTVGVAEHFYCEASSSNNQPLYRMYATSSTNGNTFIRNDSGTILINSGFGSFNNGWNIISQSLIKGSNVDTLVNGAAVDTDAYASGGTITVNRFSIGSLRRSTASGFAKMLGQEFVFWNADLSADQATIETSQNDYYNHF